VHCDPTTNPLVSRFWDSLTALLHHIDQSISHFPSNQHVFTYSFTYPVVPPDSLEKACPRELFSLVDSSPGDFRLGCELLCVLCCIKGPSISTAVWPGSHALSFLCILRSFVMKYVSTSTVVLSILFSGSVRAVTYESSKRSKATLSSLALTSIQDPTRLADACKCNCRLLLTKGLLTSLVPQQ
jgi:hypothetical protein